MECGIYKGSIKSLAVEVESAGSTLKAVPVKPVVLASARSMWALQKISALSGQPNSDRAALAKLSREYSVPIRETMWLATSENDWRFYRRALVSSQLDPLVREWWINVADGRAQSVRAKALRARIAQISRANKLDAEEETYIRLGGAYAYVIWKKYDDYAPRNKNKFTKLLAKARVARLSEKMLSYLKTQKVKNPQRSIDWASPVYSGELYDLRTKIMNEYRRSHPDYKRLEIWEKRFTILYGSTSVTNPQLSLWQARFTSLKLGQQQRAAEKSGDKAQLGKLEKARRANSYNAYFVNNIGDPPIYVSAPANAKSVIAITSDGKIKTLEYNARQKRWEGNYDIPVSMKEGEYSIRIIIVDAEGIRKSYAMKFRVDLSPPTGKGAVLVAPRDKANSAANNEKMLRLEVQHGGDVARVTALLPWGEKVSLLPSTAHDNKFFALVRAPREYSGKPIKVTYILVDRAHNLAKIEAESVSPTNLKTPTTSEMP